MQHEEVDLSKLIDQKVFENKEHCLMSYSARESRMNCNLCKDVVKAAKAKPEKVFINAYPGAGVNYNRGLVILTDSALRGSFKTMTPSVGKFFQQMLSEHKIDNYYALPNVKCDLSALEVKQGGKITSTCLELSRHILKTRLKPKVILTDDVATFNYFTGMKFMSSGKVVNHVMWSSDLNCYMLLMLNVHMFLAEAAQSKERQLEVIKLDCINRSFSIVAKILNGTYQEQIIRCRNTDYRKITKYSSIEDQTKMFDILKSSKELAIDIETTGIVPGGGLRPWDSRITSIAITYDVGKSYVFPWEYVVQNKKNFQELIFANPNITKIWANGSFDLSHLNHAGFEFVGPHIDILVWNYLYRNGLDYDVNLLESFQSTRAKSRDTNTLKFLSRVYTDLGYYEKDIKDAGGIVKAQEDMLSEEEAQEEDKPIDQGILFENLLVQDINPESALTLKDAAEVKMVDEPVSAELNMVDKYNATDTDATYRCKLALEKKLDKKLIDFYWLLMEPLIFEVIVFIYLSGIRVDLEYLDTLEEKFHGREGVPGEMQRIEAAWVEAMRKEMLESTALTAEMIIDIYKKDLKKFEETHGTPIPTDKAELLKHIELNINSPTKILKTYKALGYLSSDAKSVDASVLKHLIKEKVASAELKAQYQPVAKLYTTYVKAIKDKQIDGFIHCIFNTFFTTTGRLSSQDPNMQNIPANNTIKNIFVPRPGYSFLDYDYSQAELRVVAEVAQEKTFIDAYINDRDIHWEMTMKMFNITFPYRAEKSVFKHVQELAKFLGLTLDPMFTEENWAGYLAKNKEKQFDFEGDTLKVLDTIQKWDKYRNNAKTLNFSILYGSSEYGLARNIYKDTYDYVTETKRKEYLAECKDLLESWFKAVPNIKKWLEDNFAFAKKHGYVETMFGRRRYLVFSGSNYWKFQNSARREAGNTPIQSTASDICCLAAIEFQRFINHPENRADGCRIVNIVHDNILAEVPDEKAEYYAKALKEIMEHKVNPLKLVPLKVDGKITKRWDK